jgi:hypothetical protein
MSVMDTLHHPRLALAAAVLFLGACHHGAPAPPQFQASVDAAGQRVVVEGQPSRAVVGVTSPSGIGSADVTRTSGTWPPEVVIQLKLKGLEELRVSCGDTTVVASVSSHSTGNVEVRERLLIGSANAEPLSPESPHWMRVTIVPAATAAGSEVPHSGGYFEVAVPSALLQQRRSFTIAWVDFYR